MTNLVKSRWVDMFLCFYRPGLCLVRLDAKKMSSIQPCVTTQIYQRQAKKHVIKINHTQKTWLMLRKVSC